MRARQKALFAQRLEVAADGFGRNAEAFGKIGDSDMGAEL